MQEKLLKGGWAGLTAIITYMSGAFTPLIFIMVFFEILDYLTGVASAQKNDGGVSSKDAIWGFIKKLCYFVLVGVAFSFDYVIVETSNIAGLNFEWPALFGILSVCYLISTEGISILENLAELGISIPFLTSALKIYKDKISCKAEQSEEESQ